MAVFRLTTRCRMRLFRHATGTCCLHRKSDWASSRACWVLENVIVLRLVKKFPAFYGIQRFIIAPERPPPPPTCPCPEIDQSSAYPKTSFLNIDFDIILSATSRSSKWSLSLGFLHQNPVCASPVLSRGFSFTVLQRCRLWISAWRAS